MNDELLAEKDPEQAALLSPDSSPLKKIVAVASIAAGSQFCWALQFSLLTPYVQLLGIPHTWASFIWLCGPISGVVQPIVGCYSDRSTSRFGRRSPFIAAGAAAVVVSVLLIGYAADIGHLLGDQIGESPKTRAIAIFVVGFWILDSANNMLQVPCRALLADLSGFSQKNTRIANALFSFFMAVGYVLGYGAGSYSYLYEMLPFTETEACDVDCANLKTCFFIAIALVLTLTTWALIYVKEQSWNPVLEVSEESAPVPCFNRIYVFLKNIEKPVWMLLLVTCFHSTAFYTFTLYDTDWMGREVYGGSSSGSPVEVKLYDLGVRAGAIGLMLGAVVLGITSLSVETMAGKLGKVKILWGIGNFVLAIVLGLTVLVTKLAESGRESSAMNGISSVVPSLPSSAIKAAALALFAIAGFPQALLLTIPFALASIFCNYSGAGQGLSVGILNLSIIIPQVIVSLTSGPLDALFGGGNLPAFVVGAIAAAASGILALIVLPSPPPDALDNASARFPLILPDVYKLPNCVSASFFLSLSFRPMSSSKAEK